jgi:hypothetical protein
MCQCNESAVKTTRKAHKIYKVCIKYSNKYYLSPIIGNEYELHTTYRDPDYILERGVIIGNVANAEIQLGFHCFRSLKSARLYRKLFNDTRAVILQGVLPIGTKYREGSTDLIISAYKPYKKLNTIRATTIRLEKETL